MWLEEEDTTQRVVIELEDGRNLYYWPKSISTPYGSLSTYFSPKESEQKAAPITRE